MGINWEKLSDQELVERALRDDAVAFENLFVRYKDDIFQMYVHKNGMNVPDASDMLQETFVKVYLNLHRYKAEYTFTQWVFTIARNTFIDHTRRRRENLFSIDGDPTRPMDQPASTLPTPEENMIRDQSRSEIDRLLDTLHPSYKRMILLRFVSGYSYEEISEKLGLPLGTVKTQIHRAREKFYQLICRNENL